MLKEVKNLNAEREIRDTPVRMFIRLPAVVKGIFGWLIIFIKNEKTVLKTGHMEFQIMRRIYFIPCLKLLHTDREGRTCYKVDMHNNTLSLIPMG